MELFLCCFVEQSYDKQKKKHTGRRSTYMLNVVYSVDLLKQF